MTILDVQVRDAVAKKSMLSELRKSGRVPGVIYGCGRPEVIISVDRRKVIDFYNSGTMSTEVLKIKVGDVDENVVVKEITCHPVSNMPVSIGLMRVKKDHLVKVEVPITVRDEDKSVAIKRGGVLSVMHRFVTVKCLPDDIPLSISVDVSSLEVGKSIRIRDLNFPPNVTPIIKDETISVLKVVGKRGTSTALSGEDADEGSEGDNDEGKDGE